MHGVPVKYDYVTHSLFHENVLTIIRVRISILECLIWISAVRNLEIYDTM